MGNEESTPKQAGTTANEEASPSSNLAPFVATSPTVLVTGGAGYIGSHTTLVLVRNGYNVVAIDNFSNSFGSPDGTRSLALERVEKITGKQVRFHKCDLLDKEALDNVFSQVSEMLNLRFCIN
jgi:UDP-glucose 4-epimerase